MPVGTERTVVQTWVSHDLAEELRKAARASERSLSSEIRLAIRKHLGNPALTDGVAEDPAES